MEEIRYTLLCDGSSDRALMPVIDWLLNSKFPTISIQRNWADLSRLKRPPQLLDERIKKSIELYPCDILFIHRDAEKEPIKKREEEIKEAIKGLKILPKVIAIIPVKMQEAWLLIDEKAIRRASANPNGNITLPLPAVNQLESIPNPKQVLFELIVMASELNNRGLKKLKVNQKIHLVAEFITDFSPLRKLNAFQKFESQVEAFKIITV